MTGPALKPAAGSNALLTADDVRAAAERIAGAVIRTPTLRSQTLSAITGAEIYLKFENQQRDREMAKLRGPTELGKLPEAERAEWQKFWADFEALLRQAREKDRP